MSPHGPEVEVVSAATAARGDEDPARHRATVAAPELVRALRSSNAAATRNAMKPAANAATALAVLVFVPRSYAQCRRDRGAAGTGCAIRPIAAGSMGHKTGGYAAGKPGGNTRDGALTAAAGRAAPGYRLEPSGGGLDHGRERITAALKELVGDPPSRTRPCPPRAVAVDIDAVSARWFSRGFRCSRPYLRL